MTNGGEVQVSQLTFTDTQWEWAPYSSWAGSSTSALGLHSYCLVWKRGEALYSPCMGYIDMVGIDPITSG